MRILCRVTCLPWSLALVGPCTIFAVIVQFLKVHAVFKPTGRLASATRSFQLVRLFE